MNKQLEKAIKSMERFVECRQDMTAVTADEMKLVLKELKRLQEENKKMETEIAEHVYWNSTPLDEIKKMYIPKYEVIKKIEELEQLVKDFEKTDNTGRFKRKNSIDYYKLEALQELLEGK